MNLAIKQAKIAASIDEVPVGCVVTNQSGNIVSYGYNQTISKCDPTAHAEIIAIRSAAISAKNYRLCDFTIYVTVEPCIMCMGAIVHSRFSRLVYGAPDPKWGASGSLYDFSCDDRLNHKIEVVSGVCINQTSEIIRNFFKDKRSK
ncbi:MAG: nucleoside deaminase [Desulfamplus sp.]|nr:nucleoside deaminase [Desulfamplus sp.]